MGPFFIRIGNINQSANELLGDLRFHKRDRLSDVDRKRVAQAIEALQSALELDKERSHEPA
jgi:hypothetical protein